MSAMKQKYDLTQGSIMSKLLLVALPIMGTQLMQMLYNLTDMFWLGQVGSDVVAASGTAGMYLWMSNGFLLIGRMGAEIGVAQNLGRGDRDTARRYSQNAMFLAIVLGVFFAAVAMVFCRPLIAFFGIREAHVAKDAAEYLFITGAAVPVTYITATVAGTFNASGNSRTPFFINSIGLALNMLLDPVLIFTFDMGITGAAYATAFAQLVVCVLSVAAIRWRKTRPLGKYSFRIRPDKAMARQIFQWSIPVALESMFFTFLSMLIARFVASFGAGAIAVQRVGTQIESLSWLLAGGFGSAVTAFVGQNYGAEKWGRIRSGARISFLSMAVWGAVVTLLLIIAGGYFVQFFLPDPSLKDMGVTYLRILSICQVFGTVEAVAAGGFRGVGKTLPPSVASIGANAFRVLLVYLLSISPLGLNGIWWGISIGACIRAAWIMIWFAVMMRRQPKDDVPSEAANTGGS